MKIKLTSIYVDDQEKALRFYTEVLGFTKKADFSNGPFRWLTVGSPEEPEGAELQLALNDSRLRANQGSGRRVHHAAHGRDRLDDRHAERHLRQSHPTDGACPRVDPAVSASGPWPGRPLTNRCEGQ